MPRKKSTTSTKRTPPPREQLSLPVALLVTTSLALVLALSWLIITAAAIFHVGVGRISHLAEAAQTTPLALVSQGISGWLATPTQTNNRVNFLVLGTDELSTRGDAPPLTDTILLLSLDLSSGEIQALPIPRDTWSEEYLSRVNALYAIGLNRDLSDPTALVREEISSLSQVPIHHTIVLSLENVAELIDLVGGVEVNVPEGFVDTQFPRPDVDVTVVRDPRLLYQTVEFQPGSEVMDGERALQYIRSRHAQGSQGSDDARSVRQQLVIESLLRQLIAKPPVDNLELYGQLYAYYQTHFAPYLSMTELLAIAKTLYPIKDQVAFQGHSLSIYPQDANGVLFHPPESTTGGLWLYKIRNSELFTAEVQSKLGLQ